MPLKVCSLGSGSSGNATYVASGRTAVLVDCGLSAREIAVRLSSIGVHPNRIDAILITHAHIDHYRSAGTMNRLYGTPVHVDPSTARSLETKGRGSSWKRLRETFPIPDRIGDLEILPLDTSHGQLETDGRTVAFLLTNRGKKIGVVTDLGFFSETMIEPLRGVDAIVLEANHDESMICRKLSDPDFASDWLYLSWVLSDRGHLSNEQCARAIAAIVTSPDCHVLLGHLSDNHHDPGKDNNDYRTARETVTRFLKRVGAPRPHLHRTFRQGRTPGGTSSLLEI